MRENRTCSLGGGRWLASGEANAPPPTRHFEVGRAGYMGKRAAEVELFVGNMSSIQREDSAFYAKRRIASHDNRTRTNSSESSVRAETPFYFSCPPHHQATGLGESLSDSDQIRCRS